MRAALILLTALLLVSPAPLQAAAPDVATTAAPDPLVGLARKAVEADPRQAGPAIAALRARGTAGLSALLAEHGPRLARWFPRDPAGAGAAETAAWTRLKRALDKVAGQADAHAARLYWHTDLAAAKGAARAAGKPILSLRLLGRLDEALSCANSRYFRVALYAHPGVARALREGFILHWASERPAPIVTIDFGGGRVLRRTLTGNSAHVVLDPDGRPLDAIPGLWGPEAFRLELARVQAAAVDAWHAAPNRRQAAMAAWHQNRLSQLPAEQAAAEQRGGALRPLALPSRPPRAAEAGALAVTKAVSQNTLLRGLNELAPAPALDPATLDSLASARRPDCRLHPASLALMRGHVPPGQDPARALPLLAAGFERDLARDTAINAYQLRPAVHRAWLALPPGADADTFVARLYADVFKTPRADPWLGLMAPDAYTGLPRAGVTSP